jgi:DNA-binding Lrp family transcriptional regulator
MDLDKIDLKILGVLQRDARIRNAKLAEAVNLSQSACLARVKHLEQAGYIKGYAAVIDSEKLGQSVTVFAAISLTEQGKDRQAKFEAKLKALPEAAECHVVSGAVDYLVRFVCRDLARYHEITEALLADAAFGVKHIDSQIVLRPLKPYAGLDIAALTKPKK